MIEFQSPAQLKGNNQMNTITKSLFLASALSAYVCVADEATIKNAPIKGDMFFIQADKNHDGNLTHDEFESFKKLQEIALIERIKTRMENTRFIAFDKDNDGRITPTELKMISIEARQQMLQDLRDRESLVKANSVTPQILPESAKK